MRRSISLLEALALCVVLQTAALRHKAFAAPSNPEHLIHQTISGDWRYHGMPVGNGRLGAMFLSPIQTDEIQFNEESLWTGGENPSGNYSTKRKTRGSFGSYQNFGSALVTFKGFDKNRPSNYKRSLDVQTGLFNCSFTAPDGSDHRREGFVSRDAQCIVIRYSTTKTMSGSVSLTGAHEETSSAAGASIHFSGMLPNNLRYAAGVTVVHKGGGVNRRERSFRI